MIFVIHSPMLYCVTALFVVFCILPQVSYAGRRRDSSSDVLLNAADERIQYYPPMNETSIWSPIGDPSGGSNGVQTYDANASISVTFQGSRIMLIALAGPEFPILLITLDNSQFTTDDFFSNDTREKEVSLLKAHSKALDPSQNHTVSIMSNNGSDGTSWNILGFRITPLPPNTSSTSLSPLSQITTTTQPSSPHDSASSSTSTQKPSGKLSGGAIAGVVIGSLFAIGIVASLFVCLRRRHLHSVEFAPEPLVITPPAPPSDRSRFHRLYSQRLPHFVAPSSIWPSSTGLKSVPISSPPPVPLVRKSSHEKTVPFTLPTVAPRVIVPSPPRQRTPRRPRFSSFFVANPSSHSSHSAHSQSLKSERNHKGHGRVPEPVSSPSPWVECLDEKGEDALQEPIRVAKIKQRAANFEIDPVPDPTPLRAHTMPHRPRMTRKESIKRFFFTTNPNPNPSTSSGSSTASWNAKRVAVVDYARTQMRQKSHPRAHSKRPPLPLSIPEMSTSAPVAASIPTLTPPLSLPTANHDVPARRPCSRARQSQTVFYTCNPNPVPQVLARNGSDTSSVVPEMPPPRKDKGKERAW